MLKVKQKPKLKSKPKQKLKSKSKQKLKSKQKPKQKQKQKPKQKQKQKPKQKPKCWHHRHSSRHRKQRGNETSSSLLFKEEDRKHLQLARRAKEYSVCCVVGFVVWIAQPTSD